MSGFLQNHPTITLPLSKVKNLYHQNHLQM